MKKWRKLMATSLVGCLLNITVADLAMAQTPAGSIVIKQQVNQLGVGANVKLKLTAGEKLQDSLSRLMRRPSSSLLQSKKALRGGLRTTKSLN